MDPSNNEEFHLPRLQFSDSLWRSHPIASIRDGESFRSPSYPHPDRRQQAFSDDLQLVHARLDTLDTELASIRARVTIIEARLEAIDPEIECVACREMKRSSNMVKVSCLHSYCKSCLSALFQAATDQESSFPPKCCHLQITLSEAEDGLSEELRKRYKLKAEEFTTEDRTYCANRTCSAFLPSHQIINGTAYCRMCPAITCAKCKGYVDGTSHIRGECTRETLDKDLRELKEKKRLQQCYRCHRLIELIEGCNHVVYVPPFPSRRHDLY